MPTLRVIHRSSTFTGRELSLQSTVVKFGRDPSCDVLFDEAADRSVSRTHAEVRWEASGPVLYPAAGKIVLIRDRPINVPTPLKSGDVLEFAGPGGPKVEVQFELAPQVGTAASDMDAVATTVFEMNPSALLEAALEKKAAPPAEPPPPPPPPKAPPASAASRQAVNLPDLPLPAPRAAQAEEKSATAFISLTDAAVMAQMDRQQAPPPVQRRSRRNLLIAVGIGALVLLIAAGGVLWWREHERRERVRLAVQRVEALMDAAEGAIVPEVSEEDMRLFDEEVKANRHAPPPTPIKLPRKKAVVRAPTVDSRPEEAPSAEAAPKRTAARQAFTALQRARIALWSEADADEARRKELAAEVSKAEVACEEAAKALGAPAGDETDALIRAVVRQLGESDAVMPERFRTQAHQALETYRNDKAKRDKVASALKRASDFHTASTIASALREQGLPPELMLIPLRASGFDERRVDVPISRGIPKGMWSLLPAPANDMGLHVGKAKESLDADPTDDRQHYEREVKKIAKAMRLVFLRKAAGSSLLFLATWDHGDTELLSSVKQKAGVEPMDADPEKVNFWKLWEAGRLSDEVKYAALEYTALAAMALKPNQFGVSAAPLLSSGTVAEAR